MNPRCGIPLILLLLIAHFVMSPGKPISESKPSQLLSQKSDEVDEEAYAIEMKPVESTKYQVAMGSESRYADGRRRLAPFQLCLVCKCCAAGGSGDPSTGSCATMPCCFGIDCQLPNKPFGVCAFVPKTCNCSSCAV